MVAVGIAVAVAIIGIYALTYHNSGMEKSTQPVNNSNSTTQVPSQNSNATGKRYTEVLKENVGVTEPKK